MRAEAGFPGSGNALVRHARPRAILTLAVIGALIAGYTGLPRASEALSAIARRAMTSTMPGWHTTEPVNALVYGTRGFDTLGETFLLVAAVVSVALVARKKEPRPGAEIEERVAAEERAQIEPGGGFPELDRSGSATARRAEQAEESDSDGGDGAGRATKGAGEAPAQRGPDPREGMTVVVRVGTQVMLPVLAMAGLLVVAWGYSPGGGFPAGAVLAGVALLVYASRGLGALGPFHNQDALEIAEILASLAILGLAIAGVVVKGSLTKNVLPLGQTATITGGGNLQAFSGLELFEVAAGLLLVLFAILTMEHDWTVDTDERQKAAQ